MRWAMNVSTKPATKGDTMNSMLKPNIFSCHTTHSKADRNPTAKPMSMAANAQRLSFRNFIIDIGNLSLPNTWS